MRDDLDKLRDILDAIRHIEERQPDEPDAYYADVLIQVWIMHHLQIVGEAAARPSAGIRERYPEVPWSDVTGMRNALVHHYFGIDLD
ncbi:MAG: HepT-like ribonuclease domain-containing protein [Thermodesulfobacteriota bacterium]